MIELQNFSLGYPEPIFERVNLQVKSGELLVLCGKSGSGKSSLIQLLSGLIPELYPAELQGTGEILGQTLAARDFSAQAEQIGMVFQNPKTQFFTQDVYSELAFPMENAGLAQAEMVKRLHAVAEELGLVPFLEKTMFQLSGGEKQLVAFGSACTLAPRLFLLDEPSSNLDEATIGKLQRYLAWLKTTGATIIVAEHRLAYLMDSADRFFFLPTGMSWTKDELLQKSAAEITALGLRSVRPVELTFTEQLSPATGLTLSCRNLTHRYPKQVNGVSVAEVTLTSGTITGLIGKNGAGKSTFSQLLTGLLKGASGQFYFNGKKISARQLLQESYVVMQDVNLQLFFETVAKEITAKAGNLALYDEVVDWLALKPLLQRHPQTLSGGEKQRVAIAAALLSGKKILVFDEPTSGLDLERMQEVSRLIQRLQQQNILILIITHDKEFLQLTCQRVLQMQKGQIVADGLLN